ncbi:MAG: hypothetical protein LBG74_06900 [Spirochaetaceae bacterium]|jgi:hypothetical protein|nr:hypothetical protein [Spirochaetaceae bacterium]
MRKKIYALLPVLFFTLGSGLYAEGTLYTFVVNIVTEDFKLPLVGVANFAQGDHSIFELGALNINTGNFWGLQTAAANITSGDTTGVQMGAFNYAGKINGLQIGVINIVLDGENTIPLGLIPIVLRNGYYAAELSVSDIAPGVVAFKMGVPKLYTTLMASYHLDAGKFCFGGGLGTLLNINDFLFFNMELNSLNILDKNNCSLFSAEPNIGYKINSNLSVIAGVSIRWQYMPSAVEYKNLIRLRIAEIDANNSIVAGFKAALRYRFGGES